MRVVFIDIFLNKICRRIVAMTHAVTENCKRCRFTECVLVCPVACFHSDGEMLYIDPDECIDCSACISACPVEAIYEIVDLPDNLEIWAKINYERAKELPLIQDKEDPLPSAEQRRVELGF